MKTKYDITNLLNTKPMSAWECARIIITHLNEERSTGEWFLSYADIGSIRDGKKDNSAHYNDLIDVDENLQLMVANTYQNILNYKLMTLILNNILESYVNAIYQEDVIWCVEWIESKNKKMSKVLNVLKSTLKHMFRLTSPYAYLGDMGKNLRWEDMGKVDINNSKEVITIAMQKRRAFLGSVLAYREIIVKWCEKIQINYFLERVDAQIESLEIEDMACKRSLLILHNHFTLKKWGYDGFLKNEMDKVVEATYGDEHESFLED